MYPSLQQDLKRTRQPGQNQNQTSTIDRQIIHPRRNWKFTTPSVHFIIPSSPYPSSLDLSSKTLQSIPPPLQSFSQQTTPNMSSDYSGSTPISEQIRENPSNHPTSTQRLPHWMTQAFTQGEPNLVNDPIDISWDTSLSLPEILSLPSTSSTLSQTPSTTFPLKFSTNLDDRYRERLTNNIPYD